ncbi:MULTISPECIES: DUF1203 domain-containing protein [unclassified Novosphingobium]|uniref:DUF1203 domain-containing protein n=1 Tax=unclassified Novosphingobium TaxID=2644732 RepID=UPI0025D28782|nr:MULTISPECIES: DUF1203 domain-containing protein [unclassified Novosphingobium]HQV04005.1 DUF1203 domain-containing protein [Novosphingobium sp.]
MTYAISGLDPAQFAPLFAMSDAELAERRARRVTALADRGFPCRISLEDARAGDELILLHHTSHAVDTPYRSAYAIYVRKDAAPVRYVDCLPPVFEGRPLGLRGFDASGVLRDARLALPDDAEAKIAELLANPAIAYIDAHNAAHGCFAARIERHEGAAA